MQTLLEGKVIKGKYEIKSQLFQEKDLYCFKGNDLELKIPIQVLVVEIDFIKRTNLNGLTFKFYEAKYLQIFEKCNNIIDKA